MANEWKLSISLRVKIRDGLKVMVGEETLPTTQATPINRPVARSVEDLFTCSLASALTVSHSRSRRDDNLQRSRYGVHPPGRKFSWVMLLISPGYAHGNGDTVQGKSRIRPSDPKKPSYPRAPAGSHTPLEPRLRSGVSGHEPGHRRLGVLTSPLSPTPAAWGITTGTSYVTSVRDSYHLAGEKETQLRTHHQCTR